jgi:hypothetical protein
MDNFEVAETHYEWSEWVDLTTAFLEPALAAEPGLYRIRRIGTTTLDYIGQTGVGIRERVRMLRGILRSEMPYRDPHTAGPALWALLRSTECAFEVACIPVSGSTAYRKGLEAVALALYRQETGRSPAVNFGRMPNGYRMSSGNNKRLVAAGKRFRGGATTESDISHVAGASPAPPTSAHPTNDPSGRARAQEHSSNPSAPTATGSHRSSHNRSRQGMRRGSPIRQTPPGDARSRGALLQARETLSFVKPRVLRHA